MMILQYAFFVQLGCVSVLFSSSPLFAAILVR